MTGIIFVIGAVLGLVISIVGLAILWTTRASVTGQVTGVVSLFGDALTASQQTVAVIGSSLDQAASSLNAVQQMILDVSNTLEQSSGLVSSTSDLVGTNMVDFITNTQTSLSSVENSAKAIDSMLTKITSVPLIGSYLSGGYQPDMPLQDSVAKVSKSLEPMPEAFKKISRDLAVSSANVSTARSEVAALATQVSSIQSNVQDARKVVTEYRRILADVQSRYDKLEERLPGMISTFYVVATIVLIWVFITQVAMLLRGIQLMG